MSRPRPRPPGNQKSFRPTVFRTSAGTVKMIPPYPGDDAKRLIAGHAPAFKRGTTSVLLTRKPEILFPLVGRYSGQVHAVGDDQGFYIAKAYAETLGAFGTLLGACGRPFEMDLRYPPNFQLPKDGIEAIYLYFTDPAMTLVSNWHVPKSVKPSI